MLRSIRRAIGLHALKWGGSRKARSPASRTSARSGGRSLTIARDSCLPVNGTSGAPPTLGGRFSETCEAGRMKLGRTRNVLIPLVGLGVALAACSSSTSSAASTTSAAFVSAVRRTIGAAIFTMRSPGQVLIYEAPNRTSVESQGSTVLTIGAASYSRLPAGFPWQWIQQPVDAASTGGRANALLYLHQALGLRVTGVHGDVYDASMVATGPPVWLQTLIYPSVEAPCKSSFNTACSNFGPTYFVTRQRYPVAARVTVEGGYVTNETFLLHGFAGPSGTRSGNSTGTVTYSKIDASPHVATPPSVVRPAGP